MSLDLKRIRKLIKEGQVEDALVDVSNNYEGVEFSDGIIMLLAQKNDLEKSQIKGMMSYEEYSRLNNKITNNLLSLLKNIEKHKEKDNEELDYGSEYKEMNQKRWIEQVSDGELRQLIEELLVKERLNGKVKGKNLKKDFKHQIKILSDKISNELSRLEHLFAKRSLLPNLKDSTFIGIDFGTSNTVVSYMCYYSDRKEFNLTLPQPIELPFYKPKTINEFIIPSAIFFDKEEDILHFGVDAKRNKKYLHSEGINYWSSFKTKLGLDSGDVFFNSQLKRGQKHGKILNADHATKMFFSWLKQQIDLFIEKNSLPKNTFYSVSIPASFSSNKRLSYLKILKKTGIDTNETVLIDEPNAAFLNCLISLSLEQIKDFQQSHIIAFDFGAGTCDISILEFWQGHDGAYHSKNFSTSSDNLIGGDDIDYKIAEDVLFDVFIEEYQLQEKYMTPAQKDAIINSLKPIAEQLKINANKRLLKRPKLKGSESLITANELTSIKFNDREYNVEEFEMSFSEFEDVMLQFVDSTSRKNILTPIATALDNAKMIPEDIDYILLIGGSCKSPYVSQALKDHFQHAKIIDSGNLQTHVSKGVALNTTLIHGAGKRLIDPVVSETISLKLIDGTLLPLIEAGTPVPSNTIHIKDLAIARKKQSKIELSVFSTGSKKMIDNFKINGEFASSDKIDLEVMVDKNKKVSINIFKKTEKGRNLESSVHFLPYSTELLSEYDREVKQKERELFNLLSRGENYLNSSLVRIKISEICNLHGIHKSHKKAMDLLLNHYPNDYTSISYHAARCYKKDISLKYSKLAYETDESGVSAYNYALTFNESSTEYEQLMKESCEKDDPDAKFCYGKILVTKYKDERGTKLTAEAYAEFLADYNKDPQGLHRWQYQRLHIMAKYHNDLTTLKKLKETEEILNEKRNEMRSTTNSKNYLKKIE